MSRVRVLAALLATGAIVAGRVGADLAVPVEFREVVGESSWIVRGQVTDVRAFVVPDRGIESAATFAIEHVLKGPAGPFVSVRVPGGRVGATRSITVGAPAFSVGDRAVLFLKEAAGAGWRPVGLAAGVFRIQSDSRTRLGLVQPPLVAGRTSPAEGPAVRGDARRRLMTVAEFDALVALVLASPPGQAVPRGGR
jgi:hypothetical protein